MGTHEGVYLDGRLVIGMVRRADLYKTGADAKIVARSHQAYESSKLTGSPVKRFGFAATLERGGEARCCPRFTAWGSEVDGIVGRVRAPTAKRVEVMILLAAAVSLRYVTKA
jgi:hypothetical protein